MQTGRSPSYRDDSLEARIEAHKKKREGRRLHISKKMVNSFADFIRYETLGTSDGVPIKIKSRGDVTSED